MTCDRVENVMKMNEVLRKKKGSDEEYISHRISAGSSLASICQFDNDHGDARYAATDSFDARFHPWGSA